VSSHTRPADPPSPLERSLIALLWIEGALLLLLIVAGTFLLSLQADEAWNLLPIQTLVETGEYTHPAAPSARMSGGPDVLVQSLLFWLGADALHLLRAVALAPGEHEVRFRYAPTSFRLGVAISAVSLLLLAALCTAVHRRHAGGHAR
jgi:hypothetical protein